MFSLPRPAPIPNNLSSALPRPAPKQKKAAPCIPGIGVKEKDCQRHIVMWLSVFTDVSAASKYRTNFNFKISTQELKIANQEDFEKINFFPLLFMRKRLSSGQNRFLRPHFPLIRGMFVFRSFRHWKCRNREWGKGHFSKWKRPFPHSRSGHFQCPKLKSKTTSEYKHITNWRKEGLKLLFMKVKVLSSFIIFSVVFVFLFIAWWRQMYLQKVLATSK